jgi:hypothetical protein
LSHCLLSASARRSQGVCSEFGMHVLCTQSCGCYSAGACAWTHLQMHFVGHRAFQRGACPLPLHRLYSLLRWDPTAGYNQARSVVGLLCVIRHCFWMQVGQNTWLAVWSNATSRAEAEGKNINVMHYMAIYFSLGMLSLILQIGRSYGAVLGTVNAAQRYTSSCSTPPI